MSGHLLFPIHKTLCHQLQETEQEQTLQVTLTIRVMRNLQEGISYYCISSLIA